jgi:hypothetical protein
MTFPHRDDTRSNRVTDQRPFDRPIIALGMPRSGTTWLGKILDSHPQTLYRHEPDTWRRLDTVPLFAAPARAADLCPALREFIASLPAMLADRVCGKRPFFPKSYATPLAVRVYAGRSLLHKALGRAGLETPDPMPPQPPAGAAYRLALKSIESLGRAGLIAACIPEGRCIHIVRHPCGYVASVLRGEQQQRFGHNEAASDFELYRMACETAVAERHGITIEKIRSLTPAERLAWRWLIYNEKAHDELAANPRATMLYYEQLCAQPLPTTQRLFAFAELDWHPQAERFIADSTSASRSDYYSVFKDPLASAWGWQRELDAAVAERVMSIVARSPVARPYLEPRDWNRAA